MRTSSLNRGEWKTVCVIGAAHFYSHFFFTAIPLAFPLLLDVYAVGYTELGIGFAVFSAATLLLQTPVGFLVDRYGARWFLIGGLLMQSAVLIALGAFQAYQSYLVLMALAGAANSVYHPCDYSILTRCVRRERLGKAFSIHTFCGQSGSVASPVVIVMIAAGADWFYAFMLCGMAGLAIAALVAANLSKLPHSAEKSPVAEAAARQDRGWRVLISAPVILGWLFFAAYSMSSTGLYDFAVSAFIEIYEAPIALAGIVIWVFLVADALGILAAGFLAHRWERQQIVVANCLGAVAACMLLIVSVPMPLITLCLPMAVAGFFYGFIAPSRDIIISSLAPQKDMGKVFGVVTTGFNAGGILGPPLFGFLLDSGNPYSIFWGAGIICLASIFTLIGPISRKDSQPAKPAA